MSVCYGKADKVSAVCQQTASPGVEDIPGEPQRWSRAASLPLPEMLIDPGLSPLDECIAREEVAILKLSELAGASGVELDEPAMLWGQPIRREKRKHRKTG